MYVPQHFAASDLAALDDLVARDAFVTLVSIHDGAPFVSHLPVLYRRAGQQVELRGHWARPNPQWQTIAGQQVLAIVHGPHAYISPTWYADPDQRVPTWNYATAHLYGRVEISNDRAELKDIVSTLAAKYEAQDGSGWSYETAASYADRILGGIVGFRMPIERIELKFKLNQNHPPANVEGAIAALRAQPDDNRRDLADLMAAARRQRKPTDPADPAR